VFVATTNSRRHRRRNLLKLTAALHHLECAILITLWLDGFCVFLKALTAFF
jgi:hypothetical protein